MLGVLLHAAAILFLLRTFAPELARVPGNPPALVSIALSQTPRPPPPSRPAARHPAASALSGKAGAPARAVPVVAPPLPVTPMQPTTVTGAAAPGTGLELRSGAATGAGSGAGGTGEGPGSGDEGEGSGAGGTDLRHIAGEIRPSDYPDEAQRLDQQGDVHIRFTVGVKGRVTACQVTRSSGSPSLDETTCRLIVKRFRYEPSRDARGRPYPDTVDGVHEWRLGRTEVEEEPDDGER